MSERVCSVDGCEGKYSAKGYCKFHYGRLQNGRPLDAPKGQRSQVATVYSLCSAKDCNRAYKVRGMCKAHYDRWRHGLPIDEPIRFRQPGHFARVCSVRDCNRPYDANGYCRVHDWRHRNGSDMNDPIHVMRMSRVSDDGTKKECVGCREWKALDDFYPNPGSKLGRWPECKLCHSAKVRHGILAMPSSARHRKRHGGRRIVRETRNAVIYRAST